MKAICNSCLRISEFETYTAANEADCECGALAIAADAFCACSSCQETLGELLSGRRMYVSGIPPRVDLSRWTPEKGVQT